MISNKYKKFVPNLSPHSTRLLKKIFLENQNDNEALIKSLSDQIDIFSKKLTIDDHASAFMKHNRELISYQTCCSLMMDIINAGWKISIGIEGFVIGQPEYNDMFAGSTMSEVKDKMREVQLVNRNKQLLSHETIKFIERMEKPRAVGNEKKSILSLIDNGAELSEIFKDITNLEENKKISLLKKIIVPEISICFPDDPLFKEEELYCPYTGLRLADIWRYFRLTWSSELKSVPGKSFPILIRNAARPNKPIIGIAMLRSAALSDQARDTYIGWFDEKNIREKIYNQEIKVDFIVEQMLKVLDEQINNLRHDDFDFLNKDLIKNPDETVIKKLNKLYEEETENRKNALKFEKVNVVRIDSSDTVDWLEQSEIPLFKKKRALKLARLLETRKFFNEVNIKKNPARGYATLIHPSNKKGNDIISRALREIKIKALSENIMDLSVCGSITPYNEILGGKLVASLITSQQVRELYKKRYSSKKYQKPSIIASSNKGKPVYRDANLLCLTTTSLYGVSSSQYNRIKFLKKNFNFLKNDIIWKEIFKNDKSSYKTKGQGVYHIGDISSKLLNILTRKILKRVEVNHKFGEGTSPKLRKISAGISLLINKDKSNIVAEDFLSHNVQRKNYIFHYQKDILNDLINQKKTFSSFLASDIQSITEAWVTRWLLNRIVRNETISKLSELGPHTVQANLRPEALNNNILKINDKI